MTSSSTPDSPFLDFLNESFSSDQDISLPDRVIASPTLESLSPYGPAPTQQSSRERILSNLFKRGSKETLPPSQPSSPAASPLARHQRIEDSPLQRASSPLTPSLLIGDRPLERLSHQTLSGRTSRNTLQTPDGSTSTLSTTPSPSTQPKSILKQRPVTAMAAAAVPIPSKKPGASRKKKQRQTDQEQALPPMPMQHNPPQDQFMPQQQQQQPHQLPFPMDQQGYPLRPASPFFARPYSAAGSTDESSTSSQSQAYHITQSDMTLEGLAERWRAYQAMMAKRYAEDPFYKRWTKSKWILMFSAVLLLGYSLAVFAFCIGYMLHRFEDAVLIMELHANMVYVALVASICGIACAGMGVFGTLRENRIWLSWYTTLLWPVFALYMAVGYMAFRRAKYDLRRTLNKEWTHSYDRDRRLLIQRNLKCCGYQNPNMMGEYDLRCFPMINLPGCQHKYNLFEYRLMTALWQFSFSLVPVHLFVMIAALLCSNHVDGMYRSARPGLKSFKEQQ